MGFNDEYRQLVMDILNHGTIQDGRNGLTRVVPLVSILIKNIQDDYALRLRKMYYRGIRGEFKTLISQEPLTNVSQFEANGCNYWGAWAGPNGELNLDYWNELHPQLEDVIEGIKKDPHSRRHVISLWNHSNVKSGKLSLACCWHNMTFSVVSDTLHMTWSQRSVDTMVGLPSDVYLAYLFMEHVAEQCDLKIGSCMFSLSNVHIYEQHVPNAFELLKRTVEDYNKPLAFEVVA
jgi:thymidylate synthase